MMRHVDPVTGEVVGPFLRTPYNYDMDAASDETGLCCEDESLAIQSAKDETDINTIVRKFGLTGELPSDVKMPMEGDFTDVVDYQSALNMVIAADEAFMKMPADVRKRFHNDAAQFVEFASNPDNKDEARKLGLLMPEAVAPKVPEFSLSRDSIDALRGPVSGPGNSST